MRLQLEQRFAHDADTVARAFTDPTLYPRFAALPKVSVPDVLDHVVSGDRVTMRIRYRFDGDLSGAARALIDPSKLTWVDVSTHDLTRRRVSFALQPDHYGDRFRCAGTYRFEDTATGCRRLADVDLGVSVRLVGGTVERAIASGLAEHLADEVAVVDAHLRASV